MRFAYSDTLMVKLGRCIISNVFVKHVSRFNTIEDFIWELAQISNRMEFRNPHYNKMGLKRFTPKEELALIMDLDLYRMVFDYINGTVRREGQKICGINAEVVREFYDFKYFTATQCSELSRVQYIILEKEALKKLLNNEDKVDYSYYNAVVVMKEEEA